MKPAQYKTTPISKILAFCIVHLGTIFLQFNFCQAVPCPALKVGKSTLKVISKVCLWADLLLTPRVALRSLWELILIRQLQTALSTQTGAKAAQDFEGI